MSDIGTLFAKNVTRLRVNLNISQEKLGELCRLEKSAINRLESGKSNPTVETLEKIAKALKVQPHELLKDPGFSNDAILDHYRRKIAALESEILTLTEDLSKSTTPPNVKFIDPKFQKLVDTALGIHPDHINKATITLESFLNRGPGGKPTVKDKVFEKPKKALDVVPTKGRKT
jgi:transcriptional regulator with XRE-family HTH domain